ncbi:unnamed protein product [Soboliphyme baturini]|uniref:Amidinotransferase n=1 Tax=Soboliphyme baturini TaxID=241478 RepID=A0A183IHJ7_9BILA|nr:unnamed protein product [Soboliphyme baturini]
MKEILMCPPKYFEVTYEINPWMHKSSRVDRAKAMEQWNTLKRTIEACGAEVVTIEPIEGLPDMVFTANAALLRKKKVWLSCFKYPQRQGERKYFEEWFKNNGYEVSGDDTTFEGAGDALYAGNKLFAAHGFRSDKKVYEKIKAFFNDPTIDYHILHLIDPRFYHIDTTFCPLNSEIGIFNPLAYDEASRKEFESSMKLLVVPKDETCHFACNAVVIDNNIIMAEGTEKTTKIVEENGFKVHHVNMSEFLKSGGSCKCLTLALN